MSDHDHSAKSHVQISCFRSKSAFELNASYPEDSAIGVGSELQGFGLFVDGTVIPAQPSVAGVKVPAVFGFSKFRYMHDTQWCG